MTGWFDIKSLDNIDLKEDEAGLQDASRCNSQCLVDCVEVCACCSTVFPNILKTRCCSKGEGKPQHHIFPQVQTFCPSMHSGVPQNAAGRWQG